MTPFFDISIIKKALARTTLVIMVWCPCAGAAVENPLNLKGKMEAGSYVVHLPQGDTRLAAPLTIARGWNDVNAKTPIKIKGASDHSSRLLGSKSYQARRLKENESLPGDIKKSAKLWVIDVDDTIANLFRQVGLTSLGCPPRQGFAIFHRGKRLTCARWPNKGYARSYDVAEGNSTAATVKLDLKKASQWASGRNLQIAGYFSFDWMYSTSQIEKIDTDGNALLKAIHQPTRNAYPVRPGMRYFVAGSPEDLDAENEYLLDPISKRIYITSGAEEDEGEEYEVPVIQSLFKIFNRDNLRIENVQFEYATGNAIAAENTSGLEFSDIEIAHTQQHGIVLSNTTQSTVERARVHDIGGIGISVSGGDRANLTPSNNIIRQSIIEDTAVLLRTYNAAITISGVGATVEGNYIANTPHFAIAFHGNDHRIAHNEITQAALETSDAGAIYAGHDWTQRGTVIVGNYIHDIAGSKQHSMQMGSDGRFEKMETKGIYLDDMLSGTSIENNIFQNVEKPIFIGGGRDNTVRGNLFIKSRPQAVFVDARGLPPNSPANDPNSLIHKRLDAVPYDREPYSSRYPYLAKILTEAPGEPKRNSISDNFVVGSPSVRFGPGAEQFVLVENTMELEMGPSDEASFNALVSWLTNLTAHGGLIEAKERLAGVADTIAHLRKTVWNPIASFGKPTFE